MTQSNTQSSDTPSNFILSDKVVALREVLRWYRPLPSYTAIDSLPGTVSQEIDDDDLSAFDTRELDDGCA